MLHNWFRIERTFSRWRARPCFGEPANSYVARLIDDNGYGDPYHYSVKAKLIGSGDPVSRMLEAALQLPLREEEKESLIRWTPLPVDGQLLLSGERFSKKRLYRQGKYCSACITDAPYHRSWWDFGPFNICPVHAVPLARPEMGHWETRRWPFYGQVKFYTEPPIVDREQKDSIEAYILQRLGATEGLPRRPLLDDQPLNSTLRYATSLGRFLSNPHSTRKPRSSDSDTAVGFEALGGSQRHLEKRTSEWIARHLAPEVRRRGKRDSLGYGATILLGRQADDKLNERINAAQIRAIAKFGGLARPLLRKAEKVIHPEPSGDDVAEETSRPALEFNYDLSRHAIQSRLGITLEGLTRLLRRVDGRWIKADNGVFQLERSTSDGIAQEIEGAVPLPEVCTLLGLGAKELDRLIYAAHQQGQTMCVSIMQNGRRDRYFLREELARIRRFLHELPPCPPHIPTVSLAGMARWSKIKVGTLVSRLLSGEHCCFRSDIGGFEGLRVEQPPGFVRSYGGKPSAIGRRQLESGFMLAAEFTAMTGIGSKGVAYLVHKGILRRDGAIRRAEALQFHAAFVNVVSALKVEGELPVEVARRARDAGVKIEFPYGDVEALMAHRSDFETAFGIRTTLSPEEVHLWRGFRLAAARNAPSFIVPEVKPDGRSAIRTTTRKCSFKLEVENGTMTFTIQFTKKGSRAWTVFDANRKAIKTALPSFEWDTGSDFAVARASAATISKLDLVTAELGRFEVFFRYKMP